MLLPSTWQHASVCPLGLDISTARQNVYVLRDRRPRFRSRLRDYAAEQTHTPHAVMEAALAQVVRNKAEASYARSDLFEKRRTLMEFWSDYLAG